MRKPRLLDLFCGAGGCSAGYVKAGFDVVGVDINPQPHYPFEFIQADAMTFPLDGFDVIHASPPCQGYSKAMKHLSHGAKMLIDETRERLKASGVGVWVIENVPGAPLTTYSDLFGNHGVELCGTMFGSRVYRHRLFETSIAIPISLRCDHSLKPINPHRAASRERIYEEFGRQDPEKLWAAMMGVSWMPRKAARQAIPPAYTHWIGKRIVDAAGVTNGNS